MLRRAAVRGIRLCALGFRPDAAAGGVVAGGNAAVRTTGANVAPCVAIITDSCWRNPSSHIGGVREYAAQATRDSLRFSPGDFGRLVRDGNVDALEQGRTQGRGLILEASACAMAAEHGHLDVIKYLRKHGCPWNEWPCEHAARGGHVGVLTYAREHDCPWDQGACFKAAAANHHWDVVDWIKSNARAEQVALESSLAAAEDEVHRIADERRQRTQVRQDVHKLIQCMIVDGKREKAVKCVRDTLLLIKASRYWKVKGSMPAFIGSAFNRIRPWLEVRNQRKGRRLITVPGSITPKRQRGYIARWLLAGAKRRQRGTSLSMSEALRDEIFDVLRGRGYGITQRQQMHKQALENRMLLKRRWW